MPPIERSTADAQLERILYILAVASKPEGAYVNELAVALGVEPRTILRDLQEATARAFHHPAGAIESFSISMNRSHVKVNANTEFQRPVRLNAGEALALGLGLRALAAEADPARRAEILALAARLEKQLSVPDTGVRETSPVYGRVADAEAPYHDVEYDGDDAFALGFDDDGFRGVVADAIDEQKLCTLWYLKPGELAPMRRCVAPYRLLHASGRWYVAAYDLEREDLRIFRMDRVLDATLEQEASPPAGPELEQLLARGTPYSARDDIEVGVRYSKHVARWVLEHAQADREADGTVVIRHRVADPRWIVRHVLQYGGDAIVEEPDEARWWVAAAAASIGQQE